MMRRHRQREGGFALLLVFVFAAGIAIALYMEMPRAVFESARTKQDMLTERGEQFKIAIRRYYTKTRMFPTSLDQLENTNGVRFLRRKYVDPMTGKDEWRLIHSDGAGNPIDSKVQKPKNVAQSQASVNTLTGQGYQVGGAPPEGAKTPGVQDVAMRQRATDRMPVPGSEDAPGPDARPADGEQASPTNGSPNADGTNPVGPPVPNANGQLPGAPDSQPGPQELPTGLPTFPGVPGANPKTGNSAAAAAPTYSIGGGAGIGGSIQAETPGQTAGAPAANPNAPQQNQAAAGLMQNLLTTPRQGLSQTGSPMATGNSQMTGGILGVASKYEGEGIKVINDRTRIEEWEFLFDLKTAVAAGQAAPGTQGQGGGIPGGQGAGGFGGVGGGGNRPGGQSGGSGFGSGGAGRPPGGGIFNPAPGMGSQQPPPRR